MQKLRPLFKKLSTTVTIMFVPHSRGSSLNLRMPYALLGLLLIFAGVGAIYTVSLTYHAVGLYMANQKYANKYANISSQFQEMKSTINSLKESESEFKRLFSLGSRKKVLDAMDAPRDDGSINIEELKIQVAKSMASVTEIREYMAKARNVYRATPQGIPVDGRLSSGFGMRLHPKYGRELFHAGIDLSAQSGTPVHATADGIVSFSGWSRGNGNIVVIEHGQGFSTVYAHNTKNLMKVGQTVRRGQEIATTGSTGVTTGPHVHYEIWKNGKCINPTSFTKAASG
ncbi:MAG: M23 family metallopeptidase [Desulfuromonadaceae bacterium]|nr:M23 family metallopeptidase [Desulfuromonadaceae bacterium]MDD2848681.1 M23 family metallopeptidase [Desulfuromonadaceae bacterium]MDD4130816.1 M23 family metallopeptidase [Desulfuromonadaceae bacterium]